MKGLITKELIGMRNYYILASALGIAVIITALISKNANDFAIWFYTLMNIPIAIMASKTSDENYGWSYLESALPFNKKHIVSAKFLLGFVGLVPIVIASSVSMVIRFVKWSDTFSIEEPVYVLAYIGGALIIAAVGMMLSYRLGKTYMFSVLFAVGFSNGLVMNYEARDAGASPYPSVSIALIILAVGILLYFKAWLVSVRVYKKQGVK